MQAGRKSRLRLHNNKYGTKPYHFPLSDLSFDNIISLWPIFAVHHFPAVLHHLFLFSSLLPCYYFSCFFPEDTDDSYSNSPVWVFVWKMQRAGAARDKWREEKGWRNRSGERGKEIRGRDCEPRRETYRLFLVSSCVSHSVTVLRRPTGERSRRGDCNTSFVTHIDALKIVSPIDVRALNMHGSLARNGAMPLL